MRGGHFWYCWLRPVPRAVRSVSSRVQNRTTKSVHTAGRTGCVYVLGIRSHVLLLLRVL